MLDGMRLSLWLDLIKNVRAGFYKFTIYYFNIVELLYYDKHYFMYVSNTKLTRLVHLFIYFILIAATINKV